MPTGLQSILQGWSAQVQHCNAAAGLGTSLYVSVDKLVPSWKAEVSYLHYLMQNTEQFSMKTHH